MNYKRFIEETFPIKEVSFEGAREKNIRHGHISTLHIWWARRPLATSRATNLAALIPIPEKEEDKQKTRNFIAELSKWDNCNNEQMLSKARKMILDANGGRPPKVLDPFGGGGSIPLEALRLGCDSYSNDYNPIAIMIQKCTMEYPQKYGKLISRKNYLHDRPWLKEQILDTFNENDLINPFVEDIKYFGLLILKHAAKEIEKFYSSVEGFTTIGYFWTRTINCQNPSCNAEIPLFRTYWLCRTDKKEVALFPIYTDKKVTFKVVGNGYEPLPENFDPDKGTISRAHVTCPFCGSVTEDSKTRKLFSEGKSGERMVAVVQYSGDESGKFYRVATKSDFDSFNLAQEFLVTKSQELTVKYGYNPVPDEVIPLMSGVFNVPIYGINEWGKLFNNRQKLSLIAFTDALKNITESSPFQDIQYKSALAASFSCILNRLADKNANIVVYDITRETIEHVFGRQALPMTFDYIELNPFSKVNGDWLANLNWVIRVIEQNSKISNSCTITQSSAISLPYSDNFFDAVFTDPPYYNSVPYADLSDFFYVISKRSIGDYFPDLFSTPLAPKKGEITEMAGWDSLRYPEKDKAFFEVNLGKAFIEISRVLKPDGIAMIVYAHKSTAGWETVINALLDSGLVITASWPLSTEMPNRPRAKDSASLSSSIYIVARKMKRQPTGFYNEVKEDLKQYLSEKLDHLWSEGITGADFFIAAIGSGIEVFGKYEKVMDYEGNVKRADVLLDDVRELVMQYTVRQILHNGFSGEISELAKFYVIWRFSFGEAKAEFDEANKLARSVGIDLSEEWAHKGFIKKEKEFIRVLGPQNRKVDELLDSFDLIDVLHLTLLLYEKGKKDEMMQLLATTGYGKSEAFFRVAQAVSESLGKLTPDSKEKKLLDGFLGGKERIKSEVVNTKIRKDQQLNLEL
jgi:adenine-specific DNA methylase